MANYDGIAEEYLKSDSKPDKLYGMLPTIMQLLAPLEGKTVLDVGCGAGFFTRHIAEQNCVKVFGIDISQKQVEIARKKQRDNIEYYVGDMFSSELPECNVINAPYVLNYAKGYDQLQNLVNRFYSKLSRKGLFVSIVDLPEYNPDLENKRREWGAIKRIEAPVRDGARIDIDLYDERKKICTLNSQFFFPSTFEQTLDEAGFTNIRWHKPIISAEGRKIFGSKFWEGYEENCELGYLTAEK